MHHVVRKRLLFFFLLSPPRWKYQKRGGGPGPVSLLQLCCRHPFQKDPEASDLVRCPDPSDQLCGMARLCFVCSHSLGPGVQCTQTAAMPHARRDPPAPASPSDLPSARPSFPPARVSQGRTLTPSWPQGLPSQSSLSACTCWMSNEMKE